MKPSKEEFTFAQQVKAVAGIVAVAAFIIVGAGGYTIYQREAKAEAVKTAAAQLANVEALKTTFPVFRETAKRKEIADMAIVKVSQSELPKTITAGLDPAYSPNPTCEAGAEPSEWSILKHGVSVANTYTPSGWSFSKDGVIGIPSLSTGDYGTYTATYFSNEGCTTDLGDVGIKVYHYTFKVTPPCPTGVTLTVTATPQ